MIQKISNLTENLRRARVHWGENQEVFGARFGMNRAAYAHVESGKNSASVALLHKFSALTGISMNDFIERDVGTNELPPMPIGEDDSAERPDVAPAPSGELGEFADLREVARVLRELKMDMGKLKSLMGDGGGDKLKLFEAVNVVIRHLEAGMDETEYSEEKEAYLAKLAAHLSGGQ